MNYIMLKAVALLVFRVLVKKTAHNVNRDLKTQLGHGLKLGHPYLHDVYNCPQLVDSVFLFPTSIKPYDPFKLK